jgi:hypothetical protein
MAKTRQHTSHTILKGGFSMKIWISCPVSFQEQGICDTGNARTPEDGI